MQYRCGGFKSISEMTEESFDNCVISFEGFITSVIDLVDINDFELNLPLSQAALKILRKMIEMENPETSLPASEWESEDWEDVQDEIIEWQGKMFDLGCVRHSLSTHYPLAIHSLLTHYPLTFIVSAWS